MSLGCSPQFNTNDLYEMSNMKQVILGLNALGRVSASIDGFEGPSLSAGIERTASVNRSGKVSRLSVNLKDKINVAPPTLDPIQAAEQERREKDGKGCTAACAAAEAGEVEALLVLKELGHCSLVQDCSQARECYRKVQVHCRQERELDYKMVELQVDYKRLEGLVYK